MASLEPEHIAAMDDRWILPASHLLEWESPKDGAERVALEQLGLPPHRLRGPDVLSETYPSMIDPESGLHWDIDFVFRLDLPESELGRPPAWRELVFHPTPSLARSQIARGHGDVLALCGYSWKDDRPRPDP